MIWRTTITIEFVPKPRKGGKACDAIIDAIFDAVEELLEERWGDLVECATVGIAHSKPKREQRGDTMRIIDEQR